MGPDKAERGQVPHFPRVQVRLKREIEIVECLVVRQPGQFQRVAEPAAFPHADLFLEQQVDELQVAQLGGFGAAGEGFRLAGEVGQQQPGRVPPDPVGGQGVRLTGHGVRPSPAAAS